MDIVELLENLNVEWHQESIINLAADEIERLRNENKQLREKLSKTTYTDNFPVTEEDL
jgi:uncharacterized protein YigA (DUF484 family)